MHIKACHDCDLLIRPSDEPGRTSLCPRCGSVLYRSKRNSIDRPLAFALSGLVLFAIALTHPFLAMKSGGFIQETALLTGIFELWKQRLYGLGALVLLTCVLIPLAQLTGLLYILVPPARARRVAEYLHFSGHPPFQFMGHDGGLPHRHPGGPG